MSIRSKIVNVGLSAGLLGCLVTFIVNDSSPLRNYFLNNPKLSNFWGMLNFPIFILLTVLNPPQHVENILWYPLIFLQWFLVGCLVGVVISYFQRKL
jgi:hypothetical protein